MYTTSCWWVPWEVLINLCQEPLNPVTVGSLLKLAAIFHLNARWKSGHGNLGRGGHGIAMILKFLGLIDTESSQLAKNHPASMPLPCFSCQRSHCMTGRECCKRGTQVPGPRKQLSLQCWDGDKENLVVSHPKGLSKIDKSLGWPKNSWTHARHKSHKKSQMQSNTHKVHKPSTTR